jgi:hypothetical protein
VLSAIIGRYFPTLSENFRAELMSQNGTFGPREVIGIMRQLDRMPNPGFLAQLRSDAICSRAIEISSRHLKRGSMVATYQIE